ncbi:MULTISPECIES: cache domain-containing protein [Marinobacter]|jgi:hypothetical protein|uniref:cache domain-containing protein n=1 Tax=Marinobacter TaxID=2742 RepID=UPI002942A141|nr:cache domain-containing protein [Marinobacter salarius]WOI20351.1 cache domain-containing protein [Marinobacter salarius]
MKSPEAKNQRLQCRLNINNAIASVFGDIEHVAQEFERLWSKKVGPGRSPASADLKLLRVVADKLLVDNNRWMLGTGVVLEPGVLSDCDMYCEWRHLVGEGRPAQLDLNFNRGSDSYYNYREMPWFTRPRDLGTTTIEGPYIDLYGQDAYILTFARPLHVDGDFIGVAGADVDLGRFERALTPSLLALEHQAILLNEEGRVVASNTSDWLPGERMRDSADFETVVTSLGEQYTQWSLLEYTSVAM